MSRSKDYREKAEEQIKQARTAALEAASDESNYSDEEILAIAQLAVIPGFMAAQTYALLAVAEALDGVLYVRDADRQ